MSVHLATQDQFVLCRAVEAELGLPVLVARLSKYERIAAGADGGAVADERVVHWLKDRTGEREFENRAAPALVIAQQWGAHLIDRELFDVPDAV